MTRQTTTTQTAAQELRALYTRHQALREAYQRRGWTEAKMEEYRRIEARIEELEALPEQQLQGVLQTARTSDILAAALGKVDLNVLARREMASRGMGRNGEWVGFAKAEEIWNVTV
jgi:hypothetical protein